MGQTFVDKYKKKLKNNTGHILIIDMYI